jgi:hypothetical protein
MGYSDFQIRIFLPSPFALSAQARLARCALVF